MLLNDVILPNKEWRAQSPAKIEELVKSFSVIGQLNPIIVNTSNVLLAGMGRYLAARQLDWIEIDAKVVDFDELRSELITISENLVRSELNAYERVSQLARQKEIYEIVHPHTKQGAATKGCSQTERYTLVAANQLGIAERTIQRDIKIGSAIQVDHPALYSMSKLQLEQLSSLSDPDAQAEVCILIDEGFSVNKALEAVNAFDDDPERYEFILSNAKQGTAVNINKDKPEEHLKVALKHLNRFLQTVEHNSSDLQFLQQVEFYFNSLLESTNVQT